ncbi:MAG TPA: Spy/CpxP family protein refolding chaperone [Bacteroidota bacterium]|nr:Spy/CpxP family protein refolding chaperone [Bacteroidota bacterium]
MKLSIAIFTLAVVFVANPLSAQPGPMRGEGPGRIMEELKLTEEQQQKFEQMRFDLMKQMAAHRSKVATAHVELQELVAKDPVDKSAIEKKIKEIADLRSQGTTLRLNHWFSVNKLLTPEQQKVWKKALKARVGIGGMGMRGMGEGMRKRMRDHMDRPMRGPGFREQF